MSILVTGGTGFVASNIVRRFAMSGEEVVSIDVTPPDDTLQRFLRGTGDKISFVQGDIRDAGLLTQVAREHTVDRIVHAAVITAVNSAIEPQGPAQTINVNVMGTVRILDLARSLPSLRRMIYVSSSGVYGTTKDQDITINEDYPVDLPTLYAISKFAAEQITRRYHEMYGFEAASVRIGAPYGPMDKQTWARSHRSVMRDIIDHALRGEEIVVTQAGLDFARDWTYVEDTAHGIELLLSAPTLNHGLYNLSCGDWRSIQEIIDITTEYIPGTTCRITEDVSEVNINLTGGKPRGPLGIERISKDVGFKPSVDLREGVRAFTDWWRINHIERENAESAG